jgi:hypothetical protein
VEVKEMLTLGYQGCHEDGYLLESWAWGAWFTLAWLWPMLEQPSWAEHLSFQPGNQWKSRSSQAIRGIYFSCKPATSTHVLHPRSGYQAVKPLLCCSMVPSEQNIGKGSKPTYVSWWKGRLH